MSDPTPTSAEAVPFRYFTDKNSDRWKVGTDGESGFFAMDGKWISVGVRLRHLLDPKSKANVGTVETNEDGKPLVAPPVAAGPGERYLKPGDGIGPMWRFSNGMAHFRYADRPWISGDCTFEQLVSFGWYECDQSGTPLPAAGGEELQQLFDATPAHSDADLRDLADGIREALAPAVALEGETPRTNRARRLAEMGTDGIAGNNPLLVECEQLERDLAATVGALEEFKANPRDEYHTMDELYHYRMLYNAHACHGWLSQGLSVAKSWRHSDGEECFGGGWFIVVATLPTGQVSNHYKAEHWDLFRVPEVDLPPAYDGHSPAEAAHRLMAALIAYGRYMSNPIKSTAIQATAALAGEGGV